MILFAESSSTCYLGGSLGYLVVGGSVNSNTTILKGKIIPALLSSLCEKKLDSLGS